MLRRASNAEDNMTSELSTADYQLDFRGQKRSIRPKLLKLTDDVKNRKKNKFKVNHCLNHHYELYFAWKNEKSSVNCSAGTICST